MLNKLILENIGVTETTKVKHVQVKKGTINSTRDLPSEGRDWRKQRNKHGAEREHEGEEAPHKLRGRCSF